MSQADIAVIGLGVMGANLARNFHSRGWTVAVHNRTTSVLDGFMSEHGDARFLRCDSLQDVLAGLKSPRKIVLMVTAGRAVDAVLESLKGQLDPDDIVIDGGNSQWSDTDRRNAYARENGFRFVGMGVSGGEEGALKGPSMMPGGDDVVWPVLRPILESAAAVSDSGPCVTWCGRGSAGHFVKMVHNGIEYGDMQLIAEAWTLMRTGMSLSATEMREVFTSWNAGRLSSFLIDITAEIVAARDPQSGDPLVEHILDVAGQKGTGRWTVIAAVEAGIPLSTITAALDGRALSARKSSRVEASGIFDVPATPLVGVSTSDLEQALYASKLISYTQGFDLLRNASDSKDYGVDLAAISRVWKAGCIIRAAFLDRVYDAYTAHPDLPLLCLAPDFAEELRKALPAWRRVVAAAVTSGIPVPALSASLAWFDTLRTARGSASLIQAQRDHFGAHTYKRFDAPTDAVHSEWGQLEQL
jgi:6-phosphogluconate dehydrogenase